jgi:hypothetical protein
MPSHRLLHADLDTIMLRFSTPFIVKHRSVWQFLVVFFLVSAIAICFFDFKVRRLPLFLTDDVVPLLVLLAATISVVSWWYGNTDGLTKVITMLALGVLILMLFG